MSDPNWKWVQILVGVWVYKEWPKKRDTTVEALVGVCLLTCAQTYSLFLGKRGQRCVSKIMNSHLKKTSHSNHFIHVFLFPPSVIKTNKKTPWAYICVSPIFFRAPKPHLTWDHKISTAGRKDETKNQIVRSDHQSRPFRPNQLVAVTGPWGESVSDCAYVWEREPLKSWPVIGWCSRGRTIVLRWRGVFPLRDRAGVCWRESSSEEGPLELI